jgi:hypothetical protein
MADDLEMCDAFREVSEPEQVRHAAELLFDGRE